MSYQTLAVDDDPIFIMLMEKMLSKTTALTNYSTFESGLGALKYLKENYADDDRFVVFLDINMPEMDGWEFLDALNEFADPNRVFVFLCTSSVDDADINRGKKYPFVRSFLSKPIFTEKLLEVERILEEIQK
ncbi:MAG TPA: response regulator [Cryomorphaceae bacterium]|nr:response regulator [Cryomorphaceae bacterium]